MQELLDPRVRIGDDEILQVDRALEPAIRVDDVDRVERVGHLLRLAPHLGDRLVRAQMERHGDQLGRHDAAGRLLVVVQQLAEGAGFDLRQRGEDARLLLGRQPADQVDGVVVRQLGDDLRDAARLERAEDRFRVLVLLDLGERFGGDVGGQQLEHAHLLVDVVQLLEEVGDVGRVQVLDDGRDGGFVLGLERAVDRLGARLLLDVGARFRCARLEHAPIALALLALDLRVLGAPVRALRSLAHDSSTMRFTSSSCRRHISPRWRAAPSSWS
jgi:hypothetical protein